MHILNRLPLALAVLMLGQGANVSAQQANPSNGGEAVLGAWRATHPENGHLYMIVRKNNLVSYFWEFWKGERVMRSEWKPFGNGIYFALNSGDKLIVSRTEAGVEAFFYNAGRAMSGEPDLRMFALKVNNLDVGKWYRPKVGNSKGSGLSAEQDESEGFFGTWELVSSQGLPYHIVVEKDRTAATNWPHSNQGVEGMHGFWVRQGSELHIVWDTGHYDILSKAEVGFQKRGYPPSVELSSVEPEPQPALKVEWFPQDPWRASYEKSRKTNPITPGWKSAKQASKFFRGDWKLLSSPGELTRLELGRFGSIRGIRNGEEMRGSWRCTIDYAILRWDNGFTELIRPLGDRFISLLYSPLKNLDAVPDQVCTIEPFERWNFSLPKLFAGSKE